MITERIGVRRGLCAAVAFALAVALGGCQAASPDTSATASTASQTVAVGPDVNDPAAVTTPLRALQVLADPKSYVGESTATLADAAIEPVVADPTPHLPVTVTSHDLSGDVETTVTDTSRVVAMDIAGSIAATVWGLGMGPSLVGRDISSTFPGVTDLPVVTGSGHSINVEAVIALRPTLVITDGTIGPIDVVTQLRDVGIPVVFVNRSASFEGAGQLAREVGAALGVPDAGAALAERTAAQVAQASADIAAVAPSGDARLRMVFLYLRGTAGVYYLFGTEAGADQLITALGGVDVAGELGWPGLQPLTDEAMVAADPDLILVMTGGIESVGGVDGLLEDKPAIALTKAGQHRRFVDMADGQVLSFGPRSAEVLEALARAIYAPDAS